MNNPSKLAELQELEHWKARFDAAESANEGYFSRRWVAKHILNVNEEEFERMQVEAFYDRKHDFALEQVGEAMAAEAGGGGGMDLLGDEGAGGAPEDLETPGAEPTPGAEDEAGGEPEEAGPLLATPGGAAGPEAGEEAPGKRDKGKVYTPVKSDKRDLGARSRAISRSGTPEAVALTSTRSKWPGKKDLDSLIGNNRGLSEGLTSNYYDKEEKKLFRENNEIKKLIDSLEKSTDEIKS